MFFSFSALRVGIQFDIKNGFIIIVIHFNLQFLSFKDQPFQDEGGEIEMRTFEEIIKFAIEREEEAINSYGEIADIAKTQGLKKLLLELREEEKNHKKLLQSITEEKIEYLEIKDVIDLKISDYLVEERPSADMNFQDLLILATKKEQKAVDLYSNLEREVKRGELKKLFEFLIQQEKSHKLKLEEEYEKHILESD